MLKFIEFGCRDSLLVDMCAVGRLKIDDIRSGDNERLSRASTALYVLYDGFGSTELVLHCYLTVYIAHKCEYPTYPEAVDLHWMTACCFEQDG